MRNFPQRSECGHRTGKNVETTGLNLTFSFRYYGNFEW
jgi:hypothetical protein